MQRGNPVAEGFVKFPMGGSAYPISGGRGTYVKLVVLDEVVGQNDTLAMCTGVFVLDFLQEILTGDDKRPQPVDAVIPDDASPEETMRHLDDEQKAFNNWMRFHYPHYETASEFKHISRAYRASIVMGSSGWSGYNEQTGNWCATFNDLTAEGQALYRLMEALNPGCPIHLLTFIET